MWEGYSLLHILGNGHSQGQDLGLPGSCLKKFSTMPYLFCNLNEVNSPLGSRSRTLDYFNISKSQNSFEEAT